MSSRATVVAGLVGLQICVVCLAVVAILGGPPTPSSAEWIWGTHARGAAIPSGADLAAGGSHHVFDAGDHPSLQVDIGYADLTIVASPSASKIDVSLAGDPNATPFSANAPISVRRAGGAIRIVKAESRWSTGDDRMVTVVVPPDTRIVVADAGDIKASGLRGDASFSSVGNGSVTIDDYDGSNLQANSRGRILLQRVVAERVDVKSRDDSVEGSGLRIRDGRIESDDHANLGFMAGSDTLVTAQASDGKVEITGTGSDAASGAAKLDDDSSMQTLRIGSGAGRLDVRAGDGNIVLTQES